MSESKEKKAPEAVSTREKRDQKRQKEEKEARRSRNTYIAVGIACVALAVFAVVWSTGLIQRTAPAININGTSYTAAEVQYYYNSSKSYLVQMGLLSSSTSAKDMVYNQETGETWYDMLMDQAKSAMVRETAIYNAAKEANYTMSETYQTALDNQLEALNSSWQLYGYASRDAMIRANYGSYMTYDKLVDMMTRQFLVEDYEASITADFTYTDSDLEGYYNENADAMDTYTLSQFIFQATVDTKDADGNDIEMTDEEKAAALEEAKTAKKALAEELKAKLEAGEDAAALAEEYADDLYSSMISETRLGQSSNGGVNSVYSEWAFDSARQVGDVTLAEQDNTTSYNYTVARFEGRERDETPSHNVRHILIQPEDTSDEEQMAAAKTEAEDILAQWKAGAATEESFIALVQEHSADAGSVPDGGLIENITAESGYVDSFRDWAIDASRQPGDTGIVESSYGWHIMYYVDQKGDPWWKQTADSNLRSTDRSDWLTAIEEGYEATEGIGMKFVNG